MPNDTDRMNWLENSKNLEICSDGSIWKTELGDTFKSKYSLSRNGTKHGPSESLRDQIDAAMKLEQI